MSLIRLILASSSPRRRKLLAAAGYGFEVLSPDDAVECGICSTEGPAGLVADLATRKAIDVADQLMTMSEQEPAFIIACDTIAECGGVMLGKPTDEEHALDMLKRLRGQLHRVYSGLCVISYARGQISGDPETRIAVSQLRMEDIADADLDDYLASGLWRGKAGAFGYQDRPSWLHLEQGSETNVVGLPMELLEEMLSARGYMPTD